MTLLMFSLALAALVATHVVLQRRFAKLTKDLLIREEARRVECDELEKARRAVHYKQQKESVRIVAANNRATLKMSDQVRDLHRNAVELHASCERILKAATTDG